MVRSAARGEVRAQRRGMPVGIPLREERGEVCCQERVQSALEVTLTVAVAEAATARVGASVSRVSVGAAASCFICTVTFFSAEALAKAPREKDNVIVFALAVVLAATRNFTEKEYSAVAPGSPEIAVSKVAATPATMKSEQRVLMLQPIIATLDLPVIVMVPPAAATSATASTVRNSVFGDCFTVTVLVTTGVWVVFTVNVAERDSLPVWAESEVMVRAALSAPADGLTLKKLLVISAMRDWIFGVITVSPMS